VLLLLNASATEISEMIVSSNRTSIAHRMLRRRHPGLAQPRRKRRDFREGDRKASHEGATLSAAGISSLDTSSVKAPSSVVSSGSEPARPFSIE
jgi:hypothetical protein